MRQQVFSALGSNFLGNAPDWYKYTILAFLVLNPILIAVAGFYVTGWCLIVEFIFTLAMDPFWYSAPVRQVGDILRLRAAHPTTVQLKV